MVYCGKPSKACEPCRQRRTKCDLIQPICTQCKRAGRKCSGYRKFPSIRFRDETSETAKKALQREISRSRDASTWSIEARRQTNQASNESVSLGLSEPMENQATCFFHTIYVSGHSRSFRYLESFYQYKRQELAEHLEVSIRAVGLASLAKRIRSDQLINYARREYVTALRLTNAALRSKELAGEDSTVAAVLLLDLFEKLLSPEQQNLKSWTTHINGASTLMKVRGRDQFRSRMGIEMFVQMSAHILVSSMQRQVALPEDFLALRAEASTFLDATDPSWRLSEISARYCGLLSALKENSFPDLDAALEAFYNLDNDVQALLDFLPPTPKWQVKRISINSNSALVYENYYDVYIDYRAAEVLNSIRAGRIPLLFLIQQQCAQLLSTATNPIKVSEYTKQLTGAQNNLQMTISDICASIPQQLGYIPLLTTRISEPEISNSLQSLSMETLVDNPSTISTSFLDNQTPSNSQASACFSVLWPLFVVANLPSPPNLRSWGLSQLHFIGSVVGVEEASELAGYLDRGEVVDMWSIYTLLGNICYSHDGR